MEQPWLKEPSHLEWFTAAGLLGVVHRTKGIGHLCGYVRVPVGHPWHGIASELDIDARCHGGVTYTRAYRPGGPEPDPDDGWWVGFDCAHAGDFSPGTASFLGRQNPSAWETYRTIDYVKHEVEQLAAQALSVAAVRQAIADDRWAAIECHEAKIEHLEREVEKQRAAIEATADTLKNIRDLALSRDDFTTGNLAVDALDELVLAGVWPMPAAS